MIKDAYFVAIVLQRASLALLALSFVYVALYVQTARLSSEAAKEGAFPNSWLFTVSLLLEAFMRSGVFLDHTSLGVSRVFDALKPSGKYGNNVQDIIIFVWRVLGIEESGNGVVIRLLIATFAIYVLIFRVTRGTGATPAKKSTVAKVLSALTLLTIGGVCSLMVRSCSATFRDLPINFVPNGNGLLKLSTNLHSCVRANYGAGDALVTLALALASLSWTKASWLGLQHVLAFRWAGAVAAMLALLLQNRLNPAVLAVANPIDQTEALCVLIQVGVCLILFVPKLARKQPATTFVILTIISIMGGLAVGSIPLAVDQSHQITNLIGLLVAALGFLAIFFSGGVGIAIAMFVVLASAQVHAPWMRAMFNA